ncbi:MAG: response regulator, partial [Pseudomonadota bacterium]
FLGISDSLFLESSVIESHEHSLDPISEPLLISGGKISVTPFNLVSVAPISKYLGGHSGSLWGMVFAALTGGLVIMATALFKGLHEQSKIYRQLEEARDTLDFRVQERTSELAEANLRLQREIDQRRRTEEMQQLLTTAVEQAAEGIMITDSAGNIEYVNPAFEGITGYTKDEAIGRNPRILQSGRHDQTFYRELWGTLERGEAWKGQFVNKKKDGTLYQEDSVISPVRDRTGRIVNYVSVKRDRTVEIELQQQLFEAQKMEAIGVLAGGLAHDFNNLLQIVMGYSEAVLMRCKAGDGPGEKDRVNIERIYEAGKRGADLVKNLLTFSRKVEPEMSLVNLNQEILQIQALVSRTIPKTIKIDLRLNGDLESILADSSQIGQILLNLAVNAKDAMPNGGTLTIQTDNVELDMEFCRRHLGAEPGRYVSLFVSDSGHGMDKKTLDHIFEPFFTTKEVGKGTGLGLATVYGIVKQHRGSVLCYSEPGIGTCFKIYLPSVERRKDSESCITAMGTPGGTDTILVVDDDEIVRDMTGEFLQGFGYSVITATNGKEALAIYQMERDRIELILLDLIMPVMDGRQCLKEILRINPKAKVVIASGYSESTLASGAVAAGAKGFVQKPYNMSQILTTIREVLDMDQGY